MRSIILFFSLIAFTSSIFAYDQAKLIQSYFSVVMIRGHNESGGLAYGSGVVVDKDTVITNCHVLRTTKQPWVARGQDTYVINSVKADTWHDLCLVSTDPLPLKPVVMGSTYALKRGQEVAGIGHSNGLPAPLTSTGTVKGLHEEDNGRVIRTNARFALGASGSGLFDLEGKLIGINTFKTSGRGGSVHFALPVEWIEKLKAQEAITNFPITGKALWEEDESKKPFYMQAAVPEARAEWEALIEVSNKWTKSQPKSSDAWSALAMGYEKMEQNDLAIQNYNKALTLDANNVDVLFKLGAMAKLSGDKTEIDRVRLALSSIDTYLGEEYQRSLDCTENCAYN